MNLRYVSAEESNDNAETIPSKSSSPFTGWIVSALSLLSSALTSLVFSMASFLGGSAGRCAFHKFIKMKRDECKVC